MTERVKGCNTAKLYAKTDIYGWSPKDPPKGMTWQSWALSLLKLYPEAEQKEIGSNIKPCDQPPQEKDQATNFLRQHRIFTPACLGRRSLK